MLARTSATPVETYERDDDFHPLETAPPPVAKADRTVKSVPPERAGYLTNLVIRLSIRAASAEAESGAMKDRAARRAFLAGVPLVMGLSAVEVPTDRAHTPRQSVPSPNGGPSDLDDHRTHDPFCAPHGQVNRARLRPGLLPRFAPDDRRAPALEGASGIDFRRVGMAAFDLPHGTLLVTEASTKRRASLHLVHDADALATLAPGGAEPLETDAVGVRAAVTRENRTFKRALTDPHVISGIGNAYSDEILHRARLSPVAHTRTLDELEQTRRTGVPARVLVPRPSDS